MEEKVLIKSIKRNEVFVTILSFVISFFGMFSILCCLFMAMDEDAIEDLLGVIIIGSIVAGVAVAFVIYRVLKSSSLTVTDKRIYGVKGFGERVDLPIDSISSVSISNASKGVKVSTSSGFISFVWLENFNEIYDVINKVLIERQQHKEVNITSNIPLDNTEMLRKYKKLVDDGLISQEEYENKKKELLK